MIFFFVSLTTYFCYLVLKYQKELCLLQKSKFNISKYRKNIIKNFKQLFCTLEILSFILIVIAFNFDVRITGICVVIFYTLLFLYELRNLKNKVKLNHDIIRIIIFIIILYIILFTGFVFDYNNIEDGYFNYSNHLIYYTITIILSYLSPFIILCMGLLNNGVVKIVSLFKKIKR